MKRFWLLFSQVVTVALALFLVVAAVRPDWVSRTGDYKSVTVIEAPARDKPVPSAQTETLRTAAQKAAPSVVSILTNPDERQAAPSLSAPGDGNSEEDLFSGVGSGVIVSPSGYILTNNHVVEGATTIEVLLHDGRRTMARIIGTDPDTDLAVLQTEIKELPAITLGDSESLQVGDPVLAIGNPFGVGQTVTSGIVSALGRSQLGINTFENFIQTDAAINPGNSGGALVDIHGNLVGINTAIYSRTGGYMGHVTRGWIGVEPNDITPEIAETFKAKANQGVIITGIVQGGPASLAQMRPGDIITAVNGKPIRNVQEVLSAVAALTPGVAASFTVLREGQTQPIELVPAQRPRPEAQQPGQR